MAGVVEPQHYFLTGATGFLGKVILLDLLQEGSLKEVEGHAAAGTPGPAVSILVRQKKGVTASERLKRLKASDCFADVDPAAWARVHLVEGELSHKMDDIVGLPTDTVTHVIHCAASIRFDLPIMQAIQENVDVPVALLAWARTCNKMRRVVFVSTAYVHTPAAVDLARLDVGGAPPAVAEHTKPVNAYGLATYHALRRDGLSLNFQTCGMGHPNTYTWSKAMAERVVWEMVEEMPVHFDISFVRPSIISVALRSPRPAWCDTASTCVASIVALSTGLIRGFHMDPRTHMNVIPVDFVARSTLAGAPLAVSPIATRGRARHLWVVSVPAPSMWSHLRSAPRLFPAMALRRPRSRSTLAVIRDPLAPISESRVVVKAGAAERVRAVHVVAAWASTYSMRDCMDTLLGAMRRKHINIRVMYQSNGWWARFVAQFVERAPLRLAGAFLALLRRHTASRRMFRTADMSAAVTTAFAPFWNNSWNWQAPNYMFCSPPVGQAGCYLTLVGDGGAAYAVKYYPHQVSVDTKSMSQGGVGTKGWMTLLAVLVALALALRRRNGRAASRAGRRALAAR